MSIYDGKIEIETKDIPEPDVGQVWYNTNNKYRFIIISKKTFRYGFYGLKESMIPFAITWDTFEKSEFLGYTTADFNDLFITENEKYKIRSAHPMSHYCCTGMTMKEWEETKRE